LIFGSQLSGDDGLKLIGPGLVRFNHSANDYSGGTEINAGALWLAASGTAGSGMISLGNTTGSDSAELRMSATGTTIGNALEVRAGSSGVKTLANRATNTVNYSGSITANDNLAILLAGATGGSVFSISGAGNSIAAGKTVSFEISGGGTGRIADGALWSGEGSISYTTSDTAKGFTISGAKTYSGGATLGSMSGTGVLVVSTSSSGPANAPTGGAFGTGILTIGATRMRAVDSADITIGNAVTFTDNPTFTTIAGEKSLIFSGNVSLGADRILTVDTGSTVNTAFVGFSGEISGSGFGITKAGAGILVLSGTNTYTGDTAVSEGTLLINGDHAGATGAVAVNDATLGGTGTLGGPVTLAGGTLAPGSSTGTLTVNGPVSFDATSTYAAEVVGATAQVETATASGNAQNNGNVLAIVTGAGIAGSPLTVVVPVLAGDTPADWAPKVAAALNDTPAVTALYNVTSSGADIILTAIAPAANDPTLNLALGFDPENDPMIDESPTSADTVAGLAAAETDLLAVSGALTIASGATLKLSFNTAPTEPAYIIATCGSRSGTFTNVLNLPTGYDIDYNHNSGTAIAIVNAGSPADFAAWISNPAYGIDPAQQGLNDDPDGDSIPNGVENFLGTNPGEFSQGLIAGTADGNTFTFAHPQNATPASDLTTTYRWSTNLIDWYAGDNVDGPGGGLTVGIVADPVGPPTTTVTATASKAVPKLFLRVEVTSN
jgi:autotransporter-associated beta strand protein